MFGKFNGGIDKKLDQQEIKKWPLSRQTKC